MPKKMYYLVEGVDTCLYILEHEEIIEFNSGDLSIDGKINFHWPVKKRKNSKLSSGRIIDLSDNIKKLEKKMKKMRETKNSRNKKINEQECKKDKTTMNEREEQKIKIQTKKLSTAAGNKKIADDVIEFLQDKQDGNDDIQLPHDKNLNILNIQKTKNNKVYKRINVVDSDSSSTPSPNKTNNKNIDHGSGVYDNVITPTKNEYISVLSNEESIIKQRKNRNVMRLLLSDDDPSPQPLLNKNTSHDRDVSHNKLPLKTINLLPFTIEENITLRKPGETVKRKLELPDQNTSPINTFRPSSSSSSSSCNSSFVNNDLLSSKWLSDRYESLKKKKKYLIDLSSYLSNANEISNKLYEIATEESKEIEEHPYFTLATNLPCELQPLSSEYKHPLDEMTDSDNLIFCDPGTSKQADKSYHKTDRVNEWQFRYSKKGGSIIELINDSSVLIDKQILENIIRHCKDQRALAKSLYENIFSDEALRKCSRTGHIPKGRGKEKLIARPGLDTYTMSVISNYINKVRKEKRWQRIDERLININITQWLYSIKEKFKIPDNNDDLIKTSRMNI